MLRVKTFLDRSSTHGIGIFAGEDIPRGTLIWEFHPQVDLVYDPDQWRELRNSVASQSFAALERYCYKENGRYCLCLDNAQFMNHCAATYNVENVSAHKMVAKADIRQGEELLCNYFDYSDPDDVHLAGLK